MRRSLAVVILLALAGARPSLLGATDFTSLFGLSLRIRELVEAVSGEGSMESSAEVSAPPARIDVKAEFDRICGQVRAAPGLPDEEIERLIADSDALSELLRRSADPQAKVLLRRLTMCREFFEYTLEVRRQPRGEPGGL